ncbi:MAG: hypothetical protein ACYTBX_03550 [Planctomycetota bacterium]|jgi:hypothetical protein
MNRAQKIAWVFIAATALAAILSIITTTILYLKSGMPRALAGFAFMAVAAFGGLGSSIFKKDKGKVAFDERDKLIKEKAKLAGFTASFLFAGLASMTPFFIFGPKASISIIWLPNIWCGTFLTAFFVHSVAILVQYGWKRKGEKP